MITPVSNSKTFEAKS